MIFYRKINSFRLLFSLLYLCIIFLVPAPESRAETGAAALLNKANECRNSLFKSSGKMKYRHNWSACIDKYKSVYDRYPDSGEAAWAIFRSAKMYVSLNKYSGMEKDLDTALELYEKVTEDHSKHSLADDAQYERGNIFYNYKKDLYKAYMEYLKVDIKFPSGDMKPRAEKMIDKLAAVLEEKKGEKGDEKDISSGNELATVQEIRYLSTTTYTRVVIDLDKPAGYKKHLLEQDPENHKAKRLYLDIYKTLKGKDVKKIIPIKDGLISNARVGQYDPETLRVVLDIDKIGDYTIFPLHDPERIVIDVKVDKEKARALTRKKSARPAGKGILKPEKPDSSVSLARQLGLSVRRIVIDPGHGGKDPGCIFKGGLKEKDIVLDLAKRLKKKIEAGMDCEVFLTRTSDVFIPLDERNAFANMKDADLFISLHVNAHKQSSIYGIETYFLNMATDKRAVMVAARENATSEKNISDLQSILDELMLNTKITESSKLAYSVQEGIMSGVEKKYKKNRNLGVKQAPFYVLISADMPAILIETGFITNSTERQRLQSSTYKETISDGILNGIKSYMKSIDQAYLGG